jgi:hypothetical protein
MVAQRIRLTYVSPFLPETLIEWGPAPSRLWFPMVCFVSSLLRGKPVAYGPVRLVTGMC